MIRVERHPWFRICAAPFVISFPFDSSLASNAIPSLFPPAVCVTASSSLPFSAGTVAFVQITTCARPASRLTDEQCAQDELAQPPERTVRPMVW